MPTKTKSPARPRAKKRWKPTDADKPMDTGLQVPFDLTDFADVRAVPCPCGASRRAFMRPDNQVCSVHLVEISRDSKTHYHKGFTETYYFLEGEGQLELNGKIFPVKPGKTVMIRPGTRHRAIPGANPMRILNIVVPPFDAADEWFD